MSCDWQLSAQHGVVFETGLVEEIIKDIQGQAGYLPLLQYTLDLLWETEKQSKELRDRTLSISTYRQLGGVRGALEQRINEIYKNFSKPEQITAQLIFLKLVDIGGDEKSGIEWKPVRRRAPRVEFTDDSEQEVLSTLIDANLLVSDAPTESSHSSTIEIAHEILLTCWTTLDTWIQENRQAIALRNRLNDDVARWQVRKSEEELWGGSKLEQILELKKDPTFDRVLGGFNQTANQFISASLGKRNRQFRKRVIATSSFFTLALSSIMLYFLLGTPFVGRLLNDLGLAKYNEGHIEDAIRYYSWSLRLRPDSPLTLYNRGRAYELLSEYEKAAENYESSILVSDHKYAPAYNILARLYIVNPKNQGADISEAKKLLETALRIPTEKQLNIPSEDEGFFLVEYFKSRFDDGSNEFYLSEYYEAKYAILKNLAWAQLKLKEYPEAEETLQQAIRENARLASAYCLLAQVFEGQGDNHEALKEWQKCSDLGDRNHPDENAWIDIAKRRLTQNN
jgi:tetratricopeptide (TPR) repeat protein